MAYPTGYFNLTLAFGNPAPGFALFAFEILIFFSFFPHSFSKINFIHNLVVNIVIDVQLIVSGINILGKAPKI